MSSDFTPEDAQSLINLGQAAPLRDLAHAAQVGLLLTRFAKWANTHFSGGAAAADQAPSNSTAPAAPTVATPSSTAKAVRAAINAGKPAAPAGNPAATRVLPARVAARINRR